MEIDNMKNNAACIVGLGLLLLSPVHAAALDSVTDYPSGLPDIFAPFCTFGAQLELEYFRESNANLDNDKDRDKYTVEPSVEFEFTYQSSKHYLASATLKLARDREVKRPDGERIYESTFEVDEAYLEFPDLLEFRDGRDKFTLAFGRLKIDDSREWLYDKSVDGVLLEFELDSIDTTIELSANREELIGSDLLRHNE